jgi:glycosyltransferase involved in cell wall biosynthesis
VRTRKAHHDRGVRDAQDVRDKVGIVIPTRDRWPLLRTALASALAQEGIDVQVVVVDDASTDGTPGELEALKDPRVLVLRHAWQKGVSAARNLGLAHVTAPWVAFLDDDDVWAPGHLAAMLNSVRTSDVDPERVGLVFSGHLDVDRGRFLIGVTQAESASAVLEAFQDGINLIGGPSRVVLRTEAVREVAGFDLGLSTVADWDLWVRVSGERQVVRCPDLLVAYTHHLGCMHLDADLFLNEVTVLQAKHGWHVGGRNDPTGQHLPFCVAEVYRRGGRRFHAARWYTESFRARGQWRDLGRAAGVLLGERIIARSGLSHRTALDPSAGRWLSHVREAERATTTGLPNLTAAWCDGTEQADGLRDH